MTGPRHPWELLLSQLTGLSGLTHGWGDEDDAKRAAVDHITWTPGDVGFEPCLFNVPGTVTENTMCVPHTVSIYGGSPTVALQRAADLVGQLGLIAMPLIAPYGATPGPQPGYDLKGKSKPVKGGELAAGAWLVQIVVTLKLFTYREIFGSAPVQSATVTTQAAINGGAPQVALEATS